MKITVTKDFRCFKAGDVFDFSKIKEDYMGSIVIVGENGCGKSSLLQALRGYKNDDPTKSMHESDFKELANNISVEHEYEKIFYYDAVKDNGSDFMVAYDAMQFIDSGGFAKSRLSHGQGSLYSIGTFVEKQKSKIIPGKTLMVFDEMDNGLSLKNQSLYQNVMYKLLSLGCHVIVITHNIFTITQAVIVYDFGNKKFVSSMLYTKDLTGYVLVNPDQLKKDREEAEGKVEKVNKSTKKKSAK